MIGSQVQVKLIFLKLYIKYLKNCLKSIYIQLKV